MKLIIPFLLIAFPASLFAQNVGIGTTAPNRAKLEVHGAVGSTTGIFGGESSGISLQRNFPTIGFNQYYANGSKFMSSGYASALYLDPNTGAMGLDMLGSGATNTTTVAALRALTIAGNGNVAIKSPGITGTSLYVSRIGSTEATAGFAGSRFTSYFNYGANEDTYIRAGKEYGTVFINDVQGSKVILNGMVGINTSNPASALEVRQAGGKGIILVEPSTFSSWEFRASSMSSRALSLVHDEYYVGTFDSDGSYHAISDYRLKKDIVPLPSTIEKLIQLRPVAYEMKYNNPNHKRSTGFIAQELKTVFPELVSIGKDSSSGYRHINDLHTVNYTGLTPFIIKGIQEQQQIIQSLQNQLDALKKTVEAFTRPTGLPVAR